MMSIKFSTCIITIAAIFYAAPVYSQSLTVSAGIESFRLSTSYNELNDVTDNFFKSFHAACELKTDIVDPGLRIGHLRDHTYRGPEVGIYLKKSLPLIGLYLFTGVDAHFNISSLQKVTNRTTILFNLGAGFVFLRYGFISLQYSLPFQDEYSKSSEMFMADKWIENSWRVNYLIKLGIGVRAEI